MKRLNSIYFNKLVVNYGRKKIHFPIQTHILLYFSTLYIQKHHFQNFSKKYTQKFPISTHLTP